MSQPKWQLRAGELCGLSDPGLPEEARPGGWMGGCGRGSHPEKGRRLREEGRREGLLGKTEEEGKKRGREREGRSRRERVVLEGGKVGARGLARKLGEFGVRAEGTLAKEGAATQPEYLVSVPDGIRI